jgi:hypothetical protein
MRLIKGFLMLVLLLSLAAGGLYVASNRGLIAADALAKPLSQLAFLQPHFETIAGVTGQNAKILGSRVGEIASQSGAVLGSTTMSEKNAPPLPQRAFERARYSYCQEVIKDYESRF